MKKLNVKIELRINSDNPRNTWFAVVNGLETGMSWDNPDELKAAVIRFFNKKLAQGITPEDILND